MSGIKLLFINVFITLILITGINVYAADGSVVENIPPYSTDGTPILAAINDLDKTFSDGLSRNIINVGLTNYQIKYIKDPVVNFRIDNNIQMVRFYDERGIYESKFTISNIRNESIAVKVRESIDSWTSIELDGGSGRLYKYSDETR